MNAPRLTAASAAVLVIFLASVPAQQRADVTGGGGDGDVISPVAGVEFGPGKLTAGRCGHGQHAYFAATN